MKYKHEGIVPCQERSLDQASEKMAGDVVFSFLCVYICVCVYIYIYIYIYIYNDKYKHEWIVPCQERSLDRASEEMAAAANLSHCVRP